MRSILSLFLLLLLVFVAVNADKKHVSVRGRVNCVKTHDEYVAIIKIENAKIQLFERDGGNGCTFCIHDDFITSTKTNEKGLFGLQGGDDDVIGKHEYYVRIWVRCSMANKCDDDGVFKNYCKDYPDDREYMAKEITIPERYMYANEKDIVTYPIDFRLGAKDGRDVYRNKQEL